MKNTLVIGLILILSLALLVGCQPTQPGNTTADPGKATAVASKTPEEVKTDAAIAYVKDTVVMFAEKKDASEADFQKVTDNKVPETVTLIAVSIPKDEKAPADKELEITLSGKDKTEAIDMKVVSAKDLATQDVRVVLGKGDALSAGEYVIQIVEKGSDNKEMMTLFVGPVETTDKKEVVPVTHKDSADCACPDCGDKKTDATPAAHKDSKDCACPDCGDKKTDATPASHDETPKTTEEVKK